MPHFDAKLILVAALFLSLVLVKLLAGGRPYDAPVRRRRRFGHRGTMSPLRQLDEGGDQPRLRVVHDTEPAPDPEKDFFEEK